MPARTASEPRGARLRNNGSVDVLLVVVGLVGLLLGGDLLVRGAVALATRLNVSPMVVGLTVVGFGTSAPELVTSVQGALAGSPGIAVGNVVGSNVANVLLIVGTVALLRPIAVSPAALRRDGTALAAASLLCAAIVLHGSSGRLAGAVLVAALAAYLVGTIALERRARTPAGALYAEEAATASAPPVPAWRSGLTFAAGLAITVLGARLLVDGAVSLAAGLGVSEAVIGLTVVAIGTSLPEVATSVIAARKGQSDLALGNVIGSNLFNVLGILGVTSLLVPLEVPAAIAERDLWVMLAATALLVAFAVTGWRIERREGAALLAGYVAYLGWLTVNA